MQGAVGRIVLGFIAAVVSVLIVHQVIVYALGMYGLTRSVPWSMRPLGYGWFPWVPTIVNSAFWGGLWGILAAFVVPRLPGALSGVLGWVLFAAIIVTLVNWFVVLPIKGAPMGGGFRMPGVVVVPIVYGFWGLGMWLIARGARTALSWR